MNKTPLWLTYLLGWVTGLIFLGTEKNDEEVRWHAANSTAVFGAFSIASVIFSILNRIPVLGWLFVVLQVLLGIATFILWIMLMINAGNNSRFRVPFLTDFAEKNLINLFK